MLCLETLHIQQMCGAFRATPNGGKEEKQEKQNSYSKKNHVHQALIPNNNKLKYSQLLIKTTEIDYLSSFYNLGCFRGFSETEINFFLFCLEYRHRRHCGHPESGLELETIHMIMFPD